MLTLDNVWNEASVGLFNELCFEEKPLAKRRLEDSHQKETLIDGFASMPSVVAVAVAVVFAAVYDL